ncbi:hypothetical protein T484DRAFT_1978597 [Baffinella frigidus]|nr:hypothetical protein T484DRAFT_1978597 [Cryptophyta sp. CCMP2293]
MVLPSPPPHVFPVHQGFSEGPSEGGLARAPAPRVAGVQRSWKPGRHLGTPAVTLHPTQDAPRPQLPPPTLHRGRV